MQGRSWMAALTLATALVPASTHAAESEDSSGTATEAKTHTVKLELRIAGLGPKGCEIEVKPGHPGCKFQKLTQHVERNGIASLLIKDVLTQNADRDCTFAITIRENGQPERTVRRGLRVVSRAGVKQELLTCYLSSPSRLARVTQSNSSRR
ncbi:MAG: hypothetical protein NVSMB9_21160 [Isosphaeraceae bacterium]